jgi:hypothetical protein
MIPTLILFGLLFGRWWRVTLLVGTVGWPLLLLASDVVGLDLSGLVAAAGLAFANTAVGVGAHQAVLFIVRRDRCRRARPRRR